jgi:uncharacterized RDD family membrane protein YckC
MTHPAASEYAGPVSRAIAYLLDALLVFVVFTGGVAMVRMLTSVIGGRVDGLALQATSAYLVLPALLALYNLLFWALAGRTPGMALLGVRVVATRHRSVSWTAALVRALVLAYFPVGALWLLVDPRHQAVHDKLARTLVIRHPSPATAAASVAH